MSIAKRIIPCLDIKDSRTVKGTNFVQLKDAGDPIELAKRYEIEGADELVFLDITATEKRSSLLSKLVTRLSQELSIPFTVGGGINSIQAAYTMLQHGADKIVINSAAVLNPGFITELSNEFGSQCITVAIDAKKSNVEWQVFTHGGKKASTLELIQWARQIVDRGAGEILFTSMNHDGTKNGFAIEPLKQLVRACSTPIIASGGAGTKEHFYQVFKETNVEGALAASVFHYQEIPITPLKSYLNKNNISVRIS